MSFSLDDFFITISYSTQVNSAFLIGDVLKPLAKSVLIPFVLTAVARGTSIPGAHPLDLVKKTELIILHE